MTERRHGRAGFTAIELMVVLGVMMVILGMAVPTVLPAMRRGNVNTVFNDISICWRQARALAIANSLPSGATPDHFGIAIVQQSGQRPYVALVYDNIASGMPRLFVEGQNPHDLSTYNAGSRPVAKYLFSRSVMLLSAPLNPDPLTIATVAPVDSSDRIILVYAQYGTGLPIHPLDVSTGRGMVASSTSIGVSTTAGLASSACAVLRVQTLDYQASPKRGYGASVALYHAGFMAAQEL